MTGTCGAYRALVAACSPSVAILGALNFCRPAARPGLSARACMGRRQTSRVEPVAEIYCTGRASALAPRIDDAMRVARLPSHISPRRTLSIISAKLAARAAVELFDDDLGRFDVIVANLPYARRQRFIASPDSCCDHTAGARNLLLGGQTTILIQIASAVPFIAILISKINCRSRNERRCASFSKPAYRRRHAADLAGYCATLNFLELPRGCAMPVWRRRRRQTGSGTEPSGQRRFARRVGFTWRTRCE